MQTTDLTTKEADLNIIYGPHYIGDVVTELNLASVKYMYTDLTDIRKYYIRLGFHLYEFYCRHGYLNFGFATLYDFCETNLGLDKGAVSRCMNVYKVFNAKNDVERIGNYESRGSVMELSKRWKDYSYTQLCEMLPLTEYEREQITPDMTVKQIREYKKSLRSKPVVKSIAGFPGRYPAVPTQQEDLDPDPVASTQPDDPDPDPAPSTQLFDFDEYESKKGIIRYNYVKKCEPINKHSFDRLSVFDNRGREIIFDDQCDILLNEDGEIVIRLFYPAEPLELYED